MKCPIRYNVWVDKENKPILLDQDCLKEECAWWYRENNACSILDICADIEGLHETLIDLVEKMPHELQFRK